MHFFFLPHVFCIIFLLFINGFSVESLDSSTQVAAFLKTGPYFEGDVLYWKANEGGLSYTIKTQDATFNDGTVLNPDFEWDFGFKINLGYRLSHGDWDFCARLTHIHTHTDALKHANMGGLYPIWIQSQEPNPLSAEEIKMHWRLHLAFIDALVGKKYHPNPYLILYPQLGVRYAIVRQKFNLEYRGNMFIPEREEYLRMKNKFWGIGPYASVGIEWPFSQHFSFCATGGLSAVYGEFYIHEDEDLFEGHAKTFGMRDTFRRIAVIADGNIVLRWKKRWKRSNKGLVLQVGWDGALLFKQNHLERFFNNMSMSNPTNLGLTGFEWGAAFDF